MRVGVLGLVLAASRAQCDRGQPNFAAGSERTHLPRSAHGSGLRGRRFRPTWFILSRVTPRIYTFGLTFAIWVLVLWLTFEVVTGERGTAVFVLVLLLPCAIGLSLVVRAVEKTQTSGGRGDLLPDTTED